MDGRLPAGTRLQHALAALAAAALGLLIAWALGGGAGDAQARHCDKPRETTPDPGPIDGFAARPALPGAAALRDCDHDDDEDEDEDEPDLELWQSLSPQPPEAGRPLTYFISVHNAGSVTATGVSLRVRLPDGAELRSMQPGGACQAGDGVLTCPLGSIGDGETFLLQVTVIPRGTVTLVNQATVSSEDTGDETSQSVAALSGRSVPVLHSTFVASVVSGVILVREPGSATFRQLGPGEPLPLRSIVDARAGRVRIVSASDAQGNLQSADFFGGVFQVVQGPGPLPVTELRLVTAPAGSTPALRRAGAPGPPARSAQVRPVRRLWGVGRGRFRTRGRYGAATVRGTVWLVSDRPDGTLVVVRQGVVAVSDFVRRRTVLVRAGRSYLARAPASAPR